MKIGDTIEFTVRGKVRTGTIAGIFKGLYSLAEYGNLYIDMERGWAIHIREGVVGKVLL